MTEDKNNMPPPSVDADAALSVSEQAFLAALRAPISLDSNAFDASVMAAVRREPAPARPASRRRSGRVFGIIAAGAALAAAVTLFVVNGGSRLTPEVPATSVVVTTVTPAPAVRTVRFTLVASGASRVAVAGSFNGWNTVSTPLRRVDRDTWEADIPLGAGRYVYQFVVDGTRWVPDPRAPRDAGDDFGVTNSVVTVPTFGSA